MIWQNSGYHADSLLETQANYYRRLLDECQMLEQENAVLSLQNRWLEGDPTLTQQDAQSFLAAQTAKSHSSSSTGGPRSCSAGKQPPGSPHRRGKRRARSARVHSSRATKSHHKVASPSKKRALVNKVVTFLICACRRRAAQRICDSVEAMGNRLLRASWARLRVHTNKVAWPVTALVGALRCMENQKRIETAHTTALPGSEAALETILQQIERKSLFHGTAAAPTAQSEDHSAGSTSPKNLGRMQLALIRLRAFIRRRERQRLGSAFAWLHCWTVETGLQPDGLASLLLPGPSLLVTEDSDWKAEATLSPSTPNDPQPPNITRRSEVSELEYDPVERCFVQHSVFYAGGARSRTLRMSPAPSSARLRYQSGYKSPPKKDQGQPDHR